MLWLMYMGKHAFLVQTMRCGHMQHIWFLVLLTLYNLANCLILGGLINCSAYFLKDNIKNIPILLCRTGCVRDVIFLLCSSEISQTSWLGYEGRRRVWNCPKFPKSTRKYLKVPKSAERHPVFHMGWNYAVGWLEMAQLMVPACRHHPTLMVFPRPATRDKTMSS